MDDLPTPSWADVKASCDAYADDYIKSRPMKTPVRAHRPKPRIKRQRGKALAIDAGMLALNVALQMRADRRA